MNAAAPKSSAGADVLARIEQLRSEFSKSELHIADVLLRDTQSFARLNVKDVAAKCGVSEPTVVRFCRRVGCKGFKDFKIQIVQELAYRQASRETSTRSTSRAGSAASTNAVAAKEIPSTVHAAAKAALDLMHGSIDWHAIAVAGRLIAEARRVVIYGLGGSSAIFANEAHNRLFRLNISTVPHVDSYMQRMSAATLSEKDVAIFISSTGRPHALIDSLDLAKYHRAKCIGITPKAGAIGKDVDVCIDLELTMGGVHHFHPNPMRYAQLYAIDCIAYATAVHLGPAAESALKGARASVASLHGLAPLQPIGD